MSLEFLEKFDVVISAVDSLSTRFWLSSVLFSLIREANKHPLFIDCGTEGIVVAGPIYRIVWPHIQHEGWPGSMLRMHF